MWTSNLCKAHGVCAARRTPCTNFTFDGSRFINCLSLRGATGQTTLCASFPVVGTSLPPLSCLLCCSAEGPELCPFPGTALCCCWDTCGRDRDTVLCPGRVTEGSCSTALSTQLQISQESFRSGQGQTRGSRVQAKPCPCTGKAGGSCVPL